MNSKNIELNNSRFDGNLVQGDGNVTTNTQDTSKGLLNNNAYNNDFRAEALKEIQGLLKQLEAGNPSATEAEQIAFLRDETSASFKRRVVAALQAAGETSIEEFLDNPYVNVAKATLKGWVQAQ
jgi:hypothetical protein